MVAYTEKESFLIIGGDGFLGRHIVERLLKTHPSAQIHILDLFPKSRYPSHPSVTYHQASLLDDITSLLKTQQITAVFHTASPPHGMGRKFYENVNVEGTKNVIKCCLRAGVKKLIYTSSAGVVFDGSDLVMVDEDKEYCANPYDSYNETKAIAEEIVLQANNSLTDEGYPLLTCAIRPSGIFGPRDGQAIPNMVEAIRQGKLKVVIGSGDNLFDFTYVENVAHAHVLACEKLERENGVDGKAFHITNDEPIPFWDMPKRLALTLLPPSHPVLRSIQTIHLPIAVALTLAYISDLFVWILSPFVHLSPVFTVFRVGLITKNRTYSIKRAKKSLGYKPIYTMDEGIKLTVDWIKTQEKWNGVWMVDNEKKYKGGSHDKLFIFAAGAMIVSAAAYYLVA
ncbi:3-beta hydroxysteroid dehydrogenase/isomerase family-domain-containing protein [Paraphysoderma sedebokerense]|nr:3-beta hydroxysteroid dehydrogenase/isomerase family-domain-containing protein [Paraphysoderma sedebokerense]